MMLLPYGVELLLNSSLIRCRVASLVGQHSGIRLDPDKIQFQIQIENFVPVLGAGLTETSFLVNPSLALKIKALYLELGTLDLMQGKIVPRGIRVDAPDLIFLAEPSFRSPEQGSPPAEPVKFSWLNEFALNEDKIQKLFDLLPDSSNEIDLALNHLKSKYFKSVSGLLSISKSNQAMNLDLNIRGIRIPEPEILKIPVLRDMHMQTIESETVRLLCRLTVHDGFSGNLKIGNLYVKTDQLPGKKIIMEQAETDFQISSQSWSIRVEPIVIAFPAARAGVTFTHHPVSGTSSISFKGTGVDIMQARQVCLALGSRSRIVTQLFDILRGGRAEEVQVSFHSDKLADLFDAHGMVLRGSAEAGEVRIPETNLIVQNAQGSAFIQNGLLQVNANAGTVRGSKVDKAWLEVDLLHHNSTPFQGEFHILADLAGLPETLISLLPETQMAQELAKVHHVSGKAEGRLFLGMEHGDQRLKVQVDATDISASGIYDRIPLPLQISHGSFSFHGDKILVTGLAGEIAQNPIEDLSVLIELSDTVQLNVKSGRADLNTQDFMEWVKQSPRLMKWISPVHECSGLMHIDHLNITGPFFHPEQWAYRAGGFSRDMTLSLTSAGDFQKLSTEFEITNNSAFLNHLSADVHHLDWLGGRIDPRKLDSVSTPLKIINSQVKFTQNHKQATCRLFFPSGAELDFILSGKDLQSLVPESVILKDGDLSNASLVIRSDSDHPEPVFKGIFNSRSLENIFKKSSDFYQDVKDFTENTPFKIYTDPASTLHIDIGHLTLDPLIHRKVAKPSGASPLFLQKSARINIQTLGYKKLLFSDLKADFSRVQDNTLITLLNLNLCDIQSTGSMMFSQEETGAMGEIHVKMEATEKETASPDLSCLFKDIRLIEGPYSFSCDLTGKGPMEHFTKYLSGLISFHAHDGRIFKATLLSRILSVINILSLPDLAQEGFAYHSFEVEGEIKEGVIHLKKAVIDGENLAMTFTGWISPFENTMDLNCLVAPFKTIDTIIRYIPIVSTALQGRLISFPAKIQGSINDPAVTPLHPSAVGEGLINMMGDILKTPVRLFKGTP